MTSKPQRSGAKTKSLRVAAMGDLHMQASAVGSLRELLVEISEQADVLLLCGDLTDHGYPEEAEMLVTELRSCRIPVLGVLGNHDHEGGHQDQIKRILSGAMVILAEEPHVVEGVGFAGIKGFGGGFDNLMLGSFGEEMIKQFVFEAVNEALALENTLAKLQTDKKVVAMHYSPVRGTVEGEPLEIFPFLGSSRLAEPIDHFDVTAVFHGHAHAGSPSSQTAKGIPVYNASLPLMRKTSPKRPYALVEV